MNYFEHFSNVLATSRITCWHHGSRFGTILAFTVLVSVFVKI